MFSKSDKAIIRRLQEELPLAPEPYKAMAEELGMTEEELLNKVYEFCQKGIIRRLGATLYHREVGFKVNAMVVWIVPENRIEEVSKIMISFPQVTHCYQRPIFPNWPYNIFTMIHGRTSLECENIAYEIAETVKIRDYKLLYSTRELKKSSMIYFAEKE